MNGKRKIVLFCEWLRIMTLISEIQVGSDQEKAQSEGNSHSKNRGGKTQIEN